MNPEAKCDKCHQQCGEECIGFMTPEEYEAFIKNLTEVQKLAPNHKDIGEAE